MTTPRVLVVDDEQDICELLKLTLARMQVDAVTVNDLASARAALKRHRFSLCLTDMRLPDGDGIDLVSYIQDKFAHIPVAVITAYGNIEGAVNSLKAGAFDYVSKPVDLTALRKLVNTAIKVVQRDARDDQSDVSDQSNQSDQPKLIGESSAMQQLNATINKVARSQAPVYIYGESGTGKECVARLIHARGPRADQPFVPVNCGALPRELLESEFFGYKKGSFTGAHKDTPGLFQAASGGTLFLDEIAELPLDMQTKLLRAIQERAVRPVGSQEEIAIDVRILSATHQDLMQMVSAGQFRQDLYYRINVISLEIPKLSDRGQDILLLATYFLTQLQTTQQVYSLTPAAEQALLAYHFPGNVRELENILERAVALSETGEITVADLQLPGDARAISTSSRQQGKQGQARQGNELTDDLPGYLDQVEKDTIVRALEKNRWNKTKTAESLGISFRALRYRLKKLGLEE